MHFFREKDEAALCAAAGNRAEQLFSDGSFLCSEAVFAAINEAADEPVPADMVRCASGFAAGAGGQGCICGALSGGILALGLALGRNRPCGDNRAVMRAVKELHAWFSAAQGSACCRELVKGKGFGKKAHCRALTRQTAIKTAEIIFRSL